jgi:ABC-type branched-subunit amino acid transport system substrate-binding protein
VGISSYFNQPDLMKAQMIKRFFFLSVMGMFFTVQCVAQKHKIAIFAPLFLDSAFDGSDEYRFAKNTFPKFINPGVEFYEGAQMALDSFNKTGAQLEVFIYDTRSATESLEQQLNKKELADAELIIAHCSSNELRLLSEIALKKNIPVINATVPNDGGAGGNPYFVILNPTLKTQCEGIYKHLQKYYAINPIIVFRRKGAADNMVKTIFDDYAKSTVGVPLKLKYIDLDENFTPSQIRAHLDTVRKTVCVAGSLDMNFGKKLSSTLASLNKDYPSMVMGMPTWDGIKEFTKPEFKGLEIVYSTPFYHAKTDKVSQQISQHFNNTMYARPSDMVYRGYEVTWKFVKLLLQYKKDFASNLGSKQNKLFTDFDIQPVINKRTSVLDYFENKKLYFLKWEDGLIKSVN